MAAFFYNGGMKFHPLIAPALCLLAGVWVAHLLNLPAWPLFLVAGLLLAGLLGQGWKRGRFSPWLLGPFFLLLGAGLLAWQQGRSLPDDHVSRLVDNKPHVIIADVVSAPDPAQWGPRVILEARSLDGRPVQGLIRLSIVSPLAPPTVGSRIVLRTKLKPFTSFANPGGWDYAAHMARQGLYVRASAGKRSGLAVMGAGQMNPLRLWLERSRARLGGLMERLPKGQGRALLRALVLGQRGELSGQVRDAFSITGTAHLLAISGLHMGMVWGWGYLLFRLIFTAWPGLALRLSAPKLAALSALAFCLLYAFLAGMSTPTLRALIMATCVVGAMFFDRPYQPAGGLALAALLIVIIWPQAPLTLSFQLSFTAVAAILLAAAPLADRLKNRGLAGKTLGVVGGWLVVSAVVGAAIWPLAVQNFHQIPFLSLPANAVLTPLAAFAALPLALLGALCGLFWPGLGLEIWGLALIPCRWAVDLAQSLAAVPGAVRYVAGPGPWVIGLIYAGALCLALLKGRTRWLAGGSLALAALLLGLIQAGPPPADGRLRVWVLDVGQGSSAVARLPDGRVVVVDGGGWPGSDFDFGRNVTGPFLWSRGFSKVHIIACSHGDQDHAGGLPFLARWFSPDEIWTNGDRADEGSYGRLLQVAKERRIPLRTPGELAGLTSLGQARFRLAWPPPGGAPPGYKSNDRSLWLGLGLEQAWFWLPGDSGARMERRLAKTLPMGGVQVLAAPHHGGAGTLSAALLRRLQPRAVIISAGCANRFNMPNPKTLARARRAGAKIYSTQTWGCLELITGGRDWSIEPYLKTPRSCPCF